MYKQYENTASSFHTFIIPIILAYICCPWHLVQNTQMYTVYAQEKKKKWLVNIKWFIHLVVSQPRHEDNYRDVSIGKQLQKASTNKDILYQQKTKKKTNM